MADHLLCVARVRTPPAAAAPRESPQPPRGAPSVRSLAHAWHPGTAGRPRAMGGSWTPCWPGHHGCLDRSAPRARARIRGKLRIRNRPTHYQNRPTHCPAILGCSPTWPAPADARSRYGSAWPARAWRGQSATWARTSRGRTWRRTRMRTPSRRRRASSTGRRCAPALPRSSSCRRRRRRAVSECGHEESADSSFAVWSPHCHAKLPSGGQSRT